MEALFACPREPRMPGLLIVGGSNQGKTSLLNRFCSRHPTVDLPGAEHVQMPVVKIQCPPGPDEKRFYTALLDALYQSESTSIKTHPMDKHRQAKQIMKTVGTRVLLLDEIHNVLAGPTSKQRYFLNVLKNLSNDFCLPIIAAGTSDAQNTITTDSQLANRLLTMKLPRWGDGAEFLKLLNPLECLLPLQHPSNLKAAALASEILSLSEGILGEAVSLLTGAACAAVANGEERITLKLIRSLGFVRPSRRRTLMETDVGDGGVLDSEADPAPPGQQTIDADALVA